MDRMIYVGMAGAKMDMQRQADPNGDRVNIVMSGKFLPYKQY